MTLGRLAEIVHVSLPVRLRRAAPLLGITLADGVYLTAWPLWAVLAPAVILAFGFSVGGWHWLPHNIWNEQISAHPAVAFLQMLPLLVITVAIAALSAGLGLLLVAGYALGDLLISGATYAPYFHHFGLGWWLGHVTTAQLVSYLVFLLLAVMPTLAARALAASVPGLRLATGSTRPVLRALIAAALTALLVYAWMQMAPMAIRPLWIWMRSASSPVTVQYFTFVASPVLPLVAAGFALVRALIETLARQNENARRNAARVAATYARPQAHLDDAGHSGWLRAIVGAVLVSMLLAGMIIHLWPTALLVFTAILLLFAAHAVALPRWSGWRAWTRLMDRVPLIARWLVALAGGYAIGRGVIAAPGMGVWQNSATGAFGAELLAIVLGLALTLSLFPVHGKPAARSTLGATVSARTLLQILVPAGVVALVMHSNPASAVCLDPLCCLVSDLLAALFIAGFITTIAALVFILLNPELMVGLALESLGGDFVLAGEIFDVSADIKEVAAAARLKPISMAGWRVAAKQGWESTAPRVSRLLKKGFTSKRFRKMLAKEAATKIVTKHAEEATKVPQDPDR